MSIEPNSNKTVVCVGSALVDILAMEDDSFLDELGAAKGGMVYVDENFINNTVLRLSGSPSIVSGGSACNTAVGIGRLGGKSRFVGKRGTDKTGELFEKDIIENNVDPSLFVSSSPTGRVLSIVTPDAQRTMFTLLGAAAEMKSEDISVQCFEDAAIVHIEGYLLYNLDLLMSALNKAKHTGSLISLDLASFTIVEEFKKELDDIIKEYVDILIANEDEARVFTGISSEPKALDILSRYADIAVLKVGSRGSFISAKGESVSIKPKGTGKAIDTTGAGDLWASGFLYGFIKGLPIRKCGELGSACGYEVCQIVGAHIPDDGWERICRIV